MRKTKTKLPIHVVDVEMFADVQFLDAHDVLIVDVLEDSEDEDAFLTRDVDCVSNTGSNVLSNAEDMDAADNAVTDVTLDVSVTKELSKEEDKFFLFAKSNYKHIKKIISIINILY